MIITVASLTLRFYKSNGWTKSKIRKLLVDPTMKVTYRKDHSSKAKKKILGDLSYYAVYPLDSNKTDNRIFKKSEMDKHILDDNSFHFGGTDWYINEDK